MHDTTVNPEERAVSGAPLPGVEGDSGTLSAAAPALFAPLQQCGACHWIGATQKCVEDEVDVSGQGDNEKVLRCLACGEIVSDFVEDAAT